MSTTPPSIPTAQGLTLYPTRGEAVADALRHVDTTTHTFEVVALSRDEFVKALTQPYIVTGIPSRWPT